MEEIEETLPFFGDKATMRSILERKADEVQTAIAAEQIKLEKIAVLQRALDKECVNMIYDVELKALEAETVLSLRETIPAYDAESGLWHKLGKFMAENNTRCKSAAVFL